jgi:hypothetical protein
MEYIIFIIVAGICIIVGGTCFVILTDLGIFCYGRCFGCRRESVIQVGRAMRTTCLVSP